MASYGYGYSFNPGTFYQPPQPMGRPALYTPYARTVTPAPSYNASPGTSVFSPHGRLVSTANVGGFSAPQPGLPTPSQILRPSAGWPGNPQAALQASPLPAAQKPQVQNVYYTVNAGKESTSKKKNIKKFLLTTGAVVAGIFTTIGVAAGMLWFFYPGFIELAQSIGGRDAKAAAKALSVFKQPGDLLTRISNASKAFNQCRQQDAAHQTKSPYQQLKLKIRRWFMTAEEKAVADQEQEAAKAAQKESSQDASMGFIPTQSITALFDWLKKEDMSTPSKIEAKITQLGADSVSKSLENAENQNIFKKLISDSLENAENQKIFKKLIFEAFWENLPARPNLVSWFQRKK